MITSCSKDKRKLVGAGKSLTLEDFQDPKRRIAREKELAISMFPAAEMYTGDQHLLVMRGVKGIRARFGAQAVSVKIISAGYGLVSEDQLIAPYDVTFSDMGPKAARSWASCLRIADDVRDTIRGWPLVVFLLGDKYLSAIKPPIIPSHDGQRLLFVAKPSVAARLSAGGVTVVPAGKPEAERFGSTSHSFKGRLFEWYARCLCAEGTSLWERTCQDRTANTFMEAVRMGINIEPA